MNSYIDATLAQPILASSLPLEALLVRGKVEAGFPSPAEDLGAQRINLTQLLITHEQATYFLRASGHSMIEAGIFDKDILVVNKAIKPRHNHIVVAIVDGDFTVKQLHQRMGASDSRLPTPPTRTSHPKMGRPSKFGG